MPGPHRLSLPPSPCTGPHTSPSTTAKALLPEGAPTAADRSAALPGWSRFSAPFGAPAPNRGRLALYPLSGPHERPDPVPPGEVDRTGGRCLFLTRHRASSERRACDGAHDDRAWCRGWWF